MSKKRDQKKSKHSVAKKKKKISGPSSDTKIVDGARYRDLNFKVSQEFHRTFKLNAARYGMSMKQLLEQSFTLWSEKTR